MKIYVLQIYQMILALLKCQLHQHLQHPIVWKTLWIIICQNSVKKKRKTIIIVQKVTELFKTMIEFSWHELLAASVQ
jgi:hypothetical protein